MNAKIWWKKALLLFLLNLWLNPITVGLWELTNAILYACGHLPQPYWLGFLGPLVPTLFLWLAIGQSIVTGKKELPVWAWQFNTPDSPSSPYSQYEPTAAAYYKLGRFFGDYLWLAWRNSWYGFAFKWGYWPSFGEPVKWPYSTVRRGNDVMGYEGDPNVSSVVGGKFVYGTFRCTITRGEEVVCWTIRRCTKIGPIMFKEQWGWKTPDDFFLKTLDLQKRQNVKPPAMLAFQIYPRKAK